MGRFRRFSERSGRLGVSVQGDSDDVETLRAHFVLQVLPHGQIEAAASPEAHAQGIVGTMETVLSPFEV